MLSAAILLGAFWVNILDASFVTLSGVRAKKIALGAFMKLTKLALPYEDKEDK